MTTGYIHSVQSLGTVDGPGLRAVIFASGCPLRCAYCHNPDTWEMTGEAMTAEKLHQRIKRLYPYIKNGGVTLSGGEPLLQAEYFCELVRLFHADGISVAIDTSGCIITEAATALIDECDLVLLDLKFTTDEAYKLYTGGTLHSPMTILRHCESTGKPVWIRHVVVPRINATREDGEALGELLRGFSVVKRVELLPFRRLCIEKYEAAGIPFPLIDTPAATEDDISVVRQGLRNTLDVEC